MQDLYTVLRETGYLTRDQASECTELLEEALAGNYKELLRKVEALQKQNGELIEQLTKANRAADHFKQAIEKRGE